MVAMVCRLALLPGSDGVLTEQADQAVAILCRNGERRPCVLARGGALLSFRLSRDTPFADW
jgi:hypothetical protein